MKAPAMIALTIVLSALTGCSERKQEFCYLANTGVKVCDGDFRNGHPTGEAEKRTERQQAAEHK